MKIAIGKPISPETIGTFAHDTQGMLDYVRGQTDALSPQRVARSEYGVEFEEHYKV